MGEPADPVKPRISGARWRREDIMKPTITTRHFELNDSLRERTEERLLKLQRIFDRILDARVVVTLEKNRYTAEAIVTANGTPLTSHVTADSDKTALELVLDKLEMQVRRHKDRLTKGKRRTGLESLDTREAEEGEPIEDADLDGIVGEEAGLFEVRLTIAEAAAELRMSPREALAFVNASNQRRMLVFKRRDGQVGVVDVHLD
jgi:ribosome hibernation promoting factor